MTFNSKILIISTTLVFAFINLFSQNKDFETWTGITIKKQVSSNLELKLREELRLFENSSQINTVFTDFGGEYKISKNLSAGLFYRYIRKSNYPNFINQHKFYGSIEYKKNINQLTLAYKIKFQTKYSEIYSSYDGLIPANTLRNKISIDYKIKNKKIKPKIFVEVFYPLQYLNYNFFKIRTGGGFKYKLNKYNSIDLFFFTDKEINIKNPHTSNILALSYVFKL